MTFTKLPNQLFEEGILASLGHHELLLLLALLNLTAWHESCSPSVAELQDATGLGSTRIYEARKGLEQRGLVTIDREPGARSVYRVTLAPPEKRTPPEKRRGPESRRPPESRRGPLRKSGGDPSGKPENTPPENRRGSISKDQDLDLIRSSSSTLAYVSAADDDDFGSIERVAAPVATPASQSTVVVWDLVERLVATGVDRDVAGELAQQTPEVAERSLAAAPHRKHIRNLPGWIVSECRRGGYCEPDDLTARRRRRELEQARQQARAQEAQSRETLAEREAREWAELMAATPADALARALAQARAQFSGRMAQAGLEAPFMRAQVKELLQARASPEATG